MTRRNLMIASVACGIACALCLFMYGRSLEESYACSGDAVPGLPDGDRVQVCVAIRDIEPGEKIDESNTAVRPWVSGMLPEGAVSSLDELEDPVANAVLYAGEPVVKARAGAAESVTLEVPAGLVAVSIPVKSVAAVGGSAKPGIRVDVYATNQTATDALARNVLVLASSGEEASGRSSAEGWVTVAVPPSFVKELIAASQRAELYLAISNGAIGESGGGERESAGGPDETSGADTSSGDAAASGSEGNASKAVGVTGNAAGEEGEPWDEGKPEAESEPREEVEPPMEMDSLMRGSDVREGGGE